MEKYRILRQINNATPYIIKEFDNFHKCYMYFLKVIKNEDENVRELRSLGYYVLNDFYKNNYILTRECVKLKIEKRIGKSWKTCSLKDI